MSDSQVHVLPLQPTKLVSRESSRRRWRRLLLRSVDSAFRWRALFVEFLSWTSSGHKLTSPSTETKFLKTLHDGLERSPPITCLASGERASFDVRIRMASGWWGLYVEGRKVQEKYLKLRLCITLLLGQFISCTMSSFLFTSESVNEGHPGTFP